MKLIRLWELLRKFETFYLDQLYQLFTKLLLGAALIMVILFMIKLTSFHQKLESTQYNACLAVAGAIKGSCKENLYQEHGIPFIPVAGIESCGQFIKCL